MSTIRPVEFPRIDSEALKQGGGIPSYTRKSGSTPKPKPESVTSGKQAAETGSKQKPENVAAHKPEDDGKSSGVRFYQPRSVKVENVPELGKHIDVRV